MDCFVEGPNFVAIDPDGCIECAMCVPQCPVNAIVHVLEIAPSQIDFVKLNRLWAHQVPRQPIRHKKPPLENHEAWAEVRDKRALLGWQAVALIETNISRNGSIRPNSAGRAEAPGKGVATG